MHKIRDRRKEKKIHPSCLFNDEIKEWRISSNFEIWIFYYFFFEIWLEFLKALVLNFWIFGHFVKFFTILIFFYLKRLILQVNIEKCDNKDISKKQRTVINIKMVRTLYIPQQSHQFYRQENCWRTTLFPAGLIFGKFEFWNFRVAISHQAFTLRCDWSPGMFVILKSIFWNQFWTICKRGFVSFGGSMLWGMFN